MTRPQPHRRVLLPLLVGVAALALAVVFGLVYVDSREASKTSGTSAAATDVETAPFVSRKGRFSLRVPVDLEIHRHGRAAEFVSPDRELVLAVSPVAGSSLRDSNRALVGSLRDGGYARFEVLHRGREVMDGRQVRTTYGRAVNDAGTGVRFVALVLEGEAHNYAISAFTPEQSDPAEVLPRLHAMVNSFRSR